MAVSVKTLSEARKLTYVKGSKVLLQVVFDGVFVLAQKSDFFLQMSQRGETFCNYDGETEDCLVEWNEEEKTLEVYAGTTVK